MSKTRTVKTVIALLAIACCLCLAILYCMTSTWYDEEYLKDGYVLTYWGREWNQYKWREWYIIEHRPFYLSSDSRYVLKDVITSVDYSKQWIFLRTDSDRYWIINKSSIFRQLDYEDIVHNRPEQKEDYMSYADNVFGPVDSISFRHFMDSVGFVQNDKCHWEIQE